MKDIKVAVQAEIEKMESACDEIPFGLDEEDEQCLWVMREALKQLAQREAQIAALETTLEREREKSRRVMSQVAGIQESRDQWKANAHEFSRCADRLEAQLAELEKQKPSGWYAVENDIRDLGEPLYLDGSHKPSGWNSDYKPLYARAAPPAPVVVKRPGTKCIGWVRDAIHEHDAKWIAAVEAAGGSVADKQYMVDLLELALASLTADPVKVPDVISITEAKDRVINPVNAEPFSQGWNACRGEVLRLNAIDNTAQQYEALAGWKMVPIEPTEEMLAAGDGFMDGLSELGNAYSAMVEAAPKLEGKR